ncbi:MAG: hypothetical protein AAGI72_07890 [Pseudomonadota bacterium]
MYLDSKELKPHKREIDKHVSAQLGQIGLQKVSIECVVVDEFSSNLADATKLIEAVCDYFESIPVIVMMSIIENPLIQESIEGPKCRDFDRLYLWALTRNDIRKLVSQYNDQQYIANDNSVVSKVVGDLEALNIPRTAFNCLTMLKIYEAEFEENPVNRTEMIRRVLFLLFNVDDVPRYKTRPDQKDTEYVLGYFCETMLRNKSYYFTRMHFIETLSQYCKKNERDLDVHVIFDVLAANSIIVYRGDYFCFKFTYYILYFAAHRMHHESSFAGLILEDCNYLAYPELMEFYTGIDRRRNDALEILVRDLKEIRTTVDKQCGLDLDFNLYEILKWTPSDESIEHMQQEVATGVLQSNLPDSVKDQYADRGYDRIRPLDQSIRSILDEYSLLKLMRALIAGARALRNSDYASIELRQALLSEISEGLAQLTQVLIAVAPMMAENGKVTLEGASFLLTDEFLKMSPKERFYNVIGVLPANVIKWHMDDIYSSKMGTLIYNFASRSEDSLKKHFVNLLLVCKRPRGWEKHVEKFILSEDKNSFYLSDLYQCLCAEYKYSYATESSLGHIERLIKMTVVKHQKGVKRPGMKAISKVPDQVLPDRSESDFT